ncbi:hypothetical protein PSHT_09174 [Puccinia striiformis]|uniref:Uncharacterized protein n=1 Tax=Puccinia striiformis TaxID=27350 RepID=A0A2S4VEP7_9BASI|nr:hypothetical protein PSHT_09750 [Puccinia striiformis]POW09376.1 hypothetical protein PSHT_09174 [Puccinia striiformis]
MDLPSGHPSSDTEWVLQILPPVAPAGDHVNPSAHQPPPPGDHPRSSATVVYNRTVLTKNHQRGIDGATSTFRRRTISWNERLCAELVMFFGDWFSRHQQLVKNSSTFLVKATYFANFADVLRAYPRLDAVARIMEMKGQYIHLCQVWKVYVLLKDAIGKHRRIETPSIIEESSEDEISKSTAACASFLREGLQAELLASQ